MESVPKSISLSPKKQQPPKTYAPPSSSLFDTRALHEKMSQTALFKSTSQDQPGLLDINFASDPKAGLGAQLVNCDKESDNDMFCPGFAVIGKVLPGDTVAKRAGVAVGDVIVAVNGQGFRRFAPDYKSEEAKNLNGDDEEQVQLDNNVVSPGSAYNDMLAKIKSVKAASDPPLILSLERYDWDAQPNSWRRFLAARDGKVPDAMMMAQAHQSWREQTFPVDLTGAGIQKILKSKAVSEVHVDSEEDHPPCVYVNYGSLINLQSSGDISSDDVTNAFVMFTERMLRKAKDPRNPKTCQL